MLIHQANPPHAHTPPIPLLVLLHSQCILSWNSRNLSKQLLFDSDSSSPGAFFFSSGSGPRGSSWRHAVRKKHWVDLLFDSKGAGVYLPYVSAIPSMQKWKMHPLKIQPIIDMKLSNIAQVVVVMNIHTIDNPCHFLALNVLSMFWNLWHLQS